MATELRTQNEKTPTMRGMDMIVDITSNLFKVVVLIIHYLFSSVIQQLREIRRIHQTYVFVFDFDDTF